MNSQLVTVNDLRRNARKAVAAVKSEKKLYRGVSWDVYSRTFAWFQHKKRLDQSAQDWFKETWNAMS